MLSAGQRILTKRKNKVFDIQAARHPGKMLAAGSSGIGKQGRDLGRIDEPNQVF